MYPRIKNPRRPKISSRLHIRFISSKYPVIYQYNGRLQHVSFFGFQIRHHYSRSVTKISYNEVLSRQSTLPKVEYIEAQFLVNNLNIYNRKSFLYVLVDKNYYIKNLMYIV